MGFASSTTNGLAIENWQPPQPQERKPTLTTGNYIEAVKLLDRLPQDYCDEYPKWFKVGQTLFNINRDLLFAYTEWSKRSRKYRDGDCERNWVQFENGGPYSGDPLSIGSLRYWAGVKQQPKFVGWSLPDFLEADFHIDYIIDGVLVEKQPTIIGGGKKNLKTIIALEAGLSISHAVPFLGRFDIPHKHRVAIFSGESGPATLQERARAMMLAKGITKPDDGFRIYDTLPHFNQPLDELKKELVDHGTQVLFIDPAFKCMDGTDANNGFKMYSQLGGISDLCAELDITFLLVHHVTKSAGMENTPLDLGDLAWSGFAEWARQWWLLSRRSPYADDGNHKLYLRAGGSAGHSQLLYVDVSEGVYPERHWAASAKTASEFAAGKQDEQYRADVETVFSVLQGAGKPVAQKAIKDKIHHDRVKPLLARMVNEGKLVTVKDGRYTKYVKGNE